MKVKVFSVLLASIMIIGSSAFAVYGESAENVESSEVIPAGEGEVITIWECNNGDENYDAALQELARRATEANIDGKGYKVEATMLSWDGYHEAFMSAAMAGTAPDIACEASTAPYEYHIMGMTLDMNPIYDQWVEEGSDFVNQIPQAAWDYVTDEDGTIFGMPYGIDGAGFFYNKTVFEKAGITEFPTSWDEFKEICGKIQEIGVTPLVCSASEVKNRNSFTELFMKSNAASCINPDFTSAVMNDETQEVYQFIFDLYDAGYISQGVLGYTFEDAQRLLLAGEAGIFIGKSPTWVPEDKQDEIGILPPFAGPSADHYLTGSSFQSYYCFNQGGHDEAVLAVMKWWIENNDIIWSQGHSTRIPLRTQQMDAVVDSDLVREFAVNWPLNEYGRASIYPLEHMEPFTQPLDSEGWYGIVTSAIFAGEDWHEASEYAEQRITEIIQTALEE